MNTRPKAVTFRRQEESKREEVYQMVISLDGDGVVTFWEAGKRTRKVCEEVWASAVRRGVII